MRGNAEDPLDDDVIQVGEGSGGGSGELLTLVMCVVVCVLDVSEVKV